MQFARVFVLACSLAMIAHAIIEFNGRFEMMQTWQIIFNYAHSVQCLLVIIFCVGSCFKKNLQKYIKYALYS